MIIQLQPYDTFQLVNAPSEYPIDLVPDPATASTQPILRLLLREDLDPTGLKITLRMDGTWSACADMKPKHGTESRA